MSGTPPVGMPPVHKKKAPSSNLLDLKASQALRAADKRFQLVGLRKSGYCGHTPQYVYFKQEPYENQKGCTLNFIPQKSETPEPTSALRQRAASQPPRPHSTSVTHEVPKPTKEVRLNAAEYYQNPPIQMYPFEEKPHPNAPRQITGFGGHRVGYQFATGSSVNGQRKTELIPKVLEQQLTYPQLGKPSPIPRYPVIRGPQRAGPLGLEMFLTN